MEGFYILISIVLDTRKEDNLFWMKWIQAFPKSNMSLISLWWQFWFVDTVILTDWTLPHLQRILVFCHVFINEHVFNFLCTREQQSWEIWRDRKWSKWCSQQFWLQNTPKDLLQEYILECVCVWVWMHGCACMYCIQSFLCVCPKVTILGHNMLTE